MKYFIDLDNTLCTTIDGDYINSNPIQIRIDYVKELKQEGHHITIWTARGSSTGIDYKELTLQQLKEWDIPYDELLMGKPSYDLYIDDKSINVDMHWPIYKETSKTKKTPAEIVEKGWGREIIFINNDEYCGKILCFEKGKKFSMHYHLKKKETWYVSKGSFILVWVDTENGTTYREQLKEGEIITNERGEPHQLIALEYSEVFEVSTKHYDSDSYRMYKGD